MDHVYLFDSLGYFVFAQNPLAYLYVRWRPLELHIVGGFVDDEANALRGSAAHAAPGLDSRLWPLPPVMGAEPNSGVISD